MAGTRPGKVFSSAGVISAKGSFGLADFFLFLLEFGGDGFAFADQLFFELLIGFGVAFGGHFAQFLFEEDFALGKFGGVFGIEFSQFFFLLVGQFGGGGGAFVEAL